MYLLPDFLKSQTKQFRTSEILTTVMKMALTVVMSFWMAMINDEEIMEMPKPTGTHVTVNYLET